MRVSLIAALIGVLFSLAVDYGIWRDCRTLFRNGKKASRIYGVTAIACWIFLTVILCAPKRDIDSDILPIMWSLYAYLTVYAAKFFYLVCSLLGQLPRLWKGKRARWTSWAGLVAGLLVFGVLWEGATTGRHRIQVNELTLESPKLPEAFDGYRIVQISDLHVGTWGNDTSFVARFTDSVNARHPDLILFTGDIVNRKTDELLPFVKTLSRMKAKDGVYAVLGNHDYGDYADWASPEAKEANLRSLHQIMKDMRWKLLDNDKEFLVKKVAVNDSTVRNDSILLLGVGNWGEPPFKQYGHLTKAYSIDRDAPYNLNDNRFKLLMSHNPEHWRIIVSNYTNIDLTLSGHTHAMQFMLSLGGYRFSPSQWRYEEWAGLFEKKNQTGVKTSVYVNIGAGEVGMPFRIGAAPEITVFTLKRKINE